MYKEVFSARLVIINTLFKDTNWHHHSTHINVCSVDIYLHVMCKEHSCTAITSVSI